MDSPKPPKVRTGISSDRIIALSNGVFGTVLILLVLEIKPPLAQSEAELIQQLLALWPNFLSFVISFIISGIFWYGHYMEFHYIKHSDRIHIWLTLAFLMCIAFFPFSATLLANHLHYRTAIVIYGLNLAAASFGRYVHWRYATYGHRLVDVDMDERVIYKIQRVFLIVPFAYLLAIALSWLSIYISLVGFVLTPILYIRPPRETSYLTSLGVQPSSQE